MKVIYERYVILRPSIEGNIITDKETHKLKARVIRAREENLVIENYEEIKPDDLEI